MSLNFSYVGFCILTAAFSVEGQSLAFPSLQRLTTHRGSWTLRMVVALVVGMGRLGVRLGVDGGVRVRWGLGLREVSGDARGSES